MGFEAQDLQKILSAVSGKVTEGQGQSIEQITSLFSSADGLSKFLGGNFAQEISKSTGIDVAKLTQSLPGIISALTTQLKSSGLSSLVESLGSGTGSTVLAQQ